jgi:hypothetical protein
MPPRITQILNGKFKTPNIQLKRDVRQLVCRSRLSGILSSSPLVPRGLGGWWDPLGAPSAMAWQAPPSRVGEPPICGPYLNRVLHFQSVAKESPGHIEPC